jgi:large subunit ribosomal protein L9
MTARKTELLLLENVENLGIVGDIVKVKAGFARNYLYPQRLAERPTPSKIESLKEKRAAAQAELSRLRSEREALLERMKDVSITMVRSCNDQGALYGSVTQRDIADALMEAGYGVDVRAVRLNQSIRRVGTYVVPLQFEKDLRTEVSVQVAADRVLEHLEPEAPAPEAPAQEGDAAAPEGDAGESAAATEKPAKSPKKAAREAKTEAKVAAKASGGWGSPAKTIAEPSAAESGGKAEKKKKGKKSSDAE